MALTYQGYTITALFFDFDGTLAVLTLDFTVMRRRAKQALAQFAPFDENSQEPMLELLTRVCTPLDAERAVNARAATFAAIKAVEMEAAQRSALFPFVRPMIQTLHARGVPFAIITRNCTEAIHCVFPDVNAHCPCLLTRDDVNNVKPHPEHLQRALTALCCQPENALMVGDHPMDIVVGRAAGTLTAGVLSGEGSAERMAGEKPTILAQDVEELMLMLNVPL